MNTMADALRQAGLIKEEQQENKIKKEETNKKVELQERPIDVFRSSSIEHPSFARISIFDTSKIDWNTYSVKQPIEVWEGIVACEGTKMVDIEESKWETRKAELVRFRGIEKGIDKNQGEVSYKRLEPIHALALEASEFKVHEVLPATPELMKQYNDTKEQILMTLYAHIFPEFSAPEFKVNDYDGWKEARAASNEAMNNPLVTHVYKVKGLENEEDAEKWLLKNHPEEAIGFVYSTNTGNFNMQPCIDSISPNSYLGTRAEREEYIQSRAKAYGIEIPAFNYKEADIALTTREATQSVKAWSPKSSKDNVPKNEKRNGREDELDLSK